jgi:predicted ABC-type ATPase
VARILVLAGVNGAGKSSLLGTWLRDAGLTWFNPDSFTRRLVEQGWPLDEANAAAWSEGARRLRQAMADGTDFAFETTLGGNTIPRLLRDACQTHDVAIWFCGLHSVALHIERVADRVSQGILPSCMCTTTARPPMQRAGPHRCRCCSWIARDCIFRSR